MRHSFHRLAIGLVVLCGLAFGQAAHADTLYCADRSSVKDVVCIQIAASTFPVSGFDQFAAWAEHRDSTNSNTWYRLPSTIQILNGSNTIKSGGTSSQTSEKWIANFSADDGLVPNTYNLTARDTVSRSTVAFSLTVTKHDPTFNSLSPSATTSHVGQVVTITTDVDMFRPTGPLVFYVRPPGGAQTEVSRKTFNSGFHIIAHEPRDFPFTGIYGAPGDYRFSFKYLGDALNNVVQSGEVLVRVGPFTTTTSLQQSIDTTKQAVTFTMTANVSGAVAGWGIPSGTVEFKDGDTVLGTATLDAQSSATVTARLGKTGAHSLTAHYVGDANYQQSSSTPLSHAIQLNPALLTPIIDMLLSDPPPPPQ